MGRGSGNNKQGERISLRKVNQELLSFESFSHAVLLRDNYKCVVCQESATSAEQIIDGKLWESKEEWAGLFIDNGVSLCSNCSIKAARTEISPEELRSAAKIKEVLLPEQLTPGKYTKWGDEVLRDGKRSPGKLFYTPHVQKVLNQAGVLDSYLAYIKHPRIPHLPSSETVSEDDIRIDLSNLQGKEVVVTEKMDGENTSIYSDGYSHARSVDSGYHHSRTRAIALAKTICHEIPAGWRICAENMTAEHTIPYQNIPVLLIHSIWNGEKMLSYEETKEWSELIETPGIELAPLLYQGVFDQDAIQSSWKQQGSYGLSEGYVVRLADEIDYKDFNQSVAKWVSSSFSIAGAEHWMTHNKENKIIQ